MAVRGLSRILTPGSTGPRTAQAARSGRPEMVEEGPAPDTQLTPSLDTGREIWEEREREREIMRWPGPGHLGGGRQDKTMEARRSPPSWGRHQPLDCQIKLASLGFNQLGRTPLNTNGSNQLLSYI